MNAKRFAAGLLLVMFSSLQAFPAQDQSDKQTAAEPATVLKATTRLVIVDVVATNGKGEPVSDLRAQDFKLMESGKEQEIRVFDFQHPGENVQHSGQAAIAARAHSAKLPPNVFTNVPAYKPSSALNVILLDSLNTVTPRQAFANDELLRFMEKFVPEGPVAVYALGGSLRLIQDFTDDPQVLKNAAARLDAKASALLDNKTGGPPVVMPAVAGMPMQLQKAMRDSEQQSRDFSTGQQIRITLDALNSIARSLASYPGRKNLIWISDGFPFYINPRTATDSYSRSYGKQASEADNVLMDSQVAIYPVDAHAVQVATFNDIGVGWLHDLGISAKNAGPGALRFASTDFSERLAVHSTMNELAEETGGNAFYNSNNIEQVLRKSIADGSTYYTLGYYPQNKHWDGRFRKIDLKVNRSGVTLRHRLGYYALEPGTLAGRNGTQRATALQEALGLNSPVSSALLFEAKVLAPSEQTQNKLVVNFAIDPHTLSFEKDADGLQHATLECAVEAYSEKGALLKSEATTVNAALQPDVFARVSQSFFPCQQTLDLPAGSYSLRVGIVDDRTGLIGTANATATVPTDHPSGSTSK